MRPITDENRKWLILIAMSTVSGMVMLDETVVGVALPTVRRDLGMSEVASHWVISAYMLVFAGTAAAGGRMGDVIGFRNLIMIGVAVFGLASLACGLAEDGAFLIAARAVQGVGAALLFPSTIAMVTTVFPKEQRGRAIGILAAISTVFPAAGPLVGGFLTEIVSWRWIFWINLPIVLLIGLVVLAAWVEPSREGTRPRIDYGGLVTLVAGLGMLIFAIMQGAAWGWTQPIILTVLASGLVLLAVFVRIERRRDAPLIEVDLFRSASFSACALAILVGQFSKIAVVVFVALYLQHVLQMSPLVAGLCLLAAVVGTPIMSAPSGRLADRFGARRPALAGLALATLAMIWTGLAAGWESYALLVPGLVLWGVAFPVCFMPSARAITNAVPAETQGQAGGIIVTARLLGGTIGMAICSTLLVVTGSFQVVFLATGGLMFAVLLLAWAGIERQSGAQAP